MSEPWQVTTIGQCLATSFAGEWGSEPKPGNALVFRATDIDDEGKIIGSGAERQLPIGKLAAKHLQDGDILLEGSGGGPDKPVGRVAYFAADDCSQPAVCSNFFKTLRPARDRVEPRFLSWKLAWFYKQPLILALQQQTTGIINLKFEEYLASAITLPRSVSEQSRIAHVLDTLDNAIHETEAIIAKLKAVRQGLLHDLLTRGIDANGELRPPQAEAPHLYQDSPLGWIPKEWNASEADSEFDIDAGITLGAHRVPRCHPRKYLRVANVHRGRLVLDDIAELEASTSEVDARALSPGDLLIVEGHASTSEIGRCAIADESVRGMLFQNHLFRLRSRRLLPAFALLWLNSRVAQAYWRREAATSSGLNTINRAKLRRLPIAVPPEAEQSAIANREETVSRRIHVESRLLLKLRAQKAGLMDDLLTGRVRVTPLLEGAAS